MEPILAYLLLKAASLYKNSWHEDPDLGKPDYSISIAEAVGQVCQPLNCSDSYETTLNILLNVSWHAATDAAVNVLDPNRECSDWETIVERNAHLVDAPRPSISYSSPVVCIGPAVQEAIHAALANMVIYDENHASYRVSQVCTADNAGALTLTLVPL